jgi:hypothetical protein
MLIIVLAAIHAARPASIRNLVRDDLDLADPHVTRPDTPNDSRS